jgi:hypothetical protein
MRTRGDLLRYAVAGAATAASSHDLTIYSAGEDTVRSATNVNGT